MQYTLMPDLTWFTLKKPKETELLWNGRGSSKVGESLRTLI